MAIRALQLVPLPRPAPDDPALALRAFGLNFPNPVGLAAGFDKNALVPDALLRLGFGFVEVGGVTPLPQEGNPRPRLFRLEATRASSTGWVSTAKARRPCWRGWRHGWRKTAVRMASSASTSAPTGIRTDRAGDYVRLIETFAPVASYFTVNVSSPNTPGLRDLQQSKALDELLVACARGARQRQTAGRTRSGPAQDRARPDAARSR